MAAPARWPLASVKASLCTCGGSCPIWASWSNSPVKKRSPDPSGRTVTLVSVMWRTSFARSVSPVSVSSRWSVTV